MVYCISILTFDTVETAVLGVIFWY